MLQRLIDETTAERFRQLVADSRKPVIVCHMGPDGDAIGSGLCMLHVLQNMGKEAVFVAPDMPPANLKFMPGFSDVIVASESPDVAAKIVAESDLLLCVDFNQLHRTGRMQDLLAEADFRKVLIDHHIDPQVNAELVISFPNISSTCALLFRVLHDSGMEGLINLTAAECCCVGMMTDTGNFAYNSADPVLYLILARLVEIGVDKDRLYNKIFNTNTYNRLRIMGFAQYARMELMPKHHAALITLSHDDLMEFGYEKGDTESLVNVPLSVDGVVYSVYLREDSTNYVKVSMRSKGDFSVKEICQKYFGGGGHCNAAGGDFHGSLPEAVDLLLQIMPKYDAQAAKTEEIISKL